MIDFKLHKAQQPEEKVNNEEIQQELLNFSTFLCLINGKKINPILLITMILEEEKLLKFMKEKLMTTNDYVVFEKILLQYPKLLKSKIIKQALKIHLKKQHGHT